MNPDLEDCFHPQILMDKSFSNFWAFTSVDERSTTAPPRAHLFNMLPMSPTVFDKYVPAV